MSRIYYTDLPDETYPIIASRTNGLLNGEESIEKIVAGSIEGKNLFDKDNNINYYNWLIYQNGEIGYSNISPIRLIQIPIVGGRTYTISKVAGTRFRASTSDKDVSQFSKTTNNGVNSHVTNDTGATITITSTASDKYLYFTIADSETDYNTKKQSTMVEVGDTASDYIPYKKYGYNSEESMGNIVVDDVNCKNMFDNLFRQGSWFDTINATRIYSSQKLYLKAGTYTVSTNLNFTTFDYAIDLATFTSPAGAGHSPDIYDSGWLSTLSHTFTISQSGYFYIGVRKKDNSNITPSDISSTYFQLEQGSEATSYTPFKSFDATAYVLWTNPDDTQSFANQLVSLNDALANYKYYEIIYKRSTTMSRYLSTGRIPTNKASDMITNLNYNYIRTISEIWASSFRISDCSYYATYGSTTSTTNNNFIIPYQILGYK